MKYIMYKLLVNYTMYTIKYSVYNEVDYWVYYPTMLGTCFTHIIYVKNCNKNGSDW